MEKIRKPSRHFSKSTAWISVLMLTTCNTLLLKEPWEEEWKDAREGIDSRFAVYAWLLGFGLIGSALIATASVTEFWSETLADFLLFMGVAIGLLGLGGFVSYVAALIFGFRPSWITDCTALILAYLGYLLFKAF